MSLELPGVSSTTGPTWATNINTAFETIDEHDHSTGSGKKITTSGLNINADLSLNDNNLTDIDELEFNALSSATATLRSLQVVEKDLYYNDGDGNNIRFTTGGALDVSSSTGIGGDYGSTAAVVNYSDVTKKYSFLDSAANAAGLVIGHIDFDASGDQEFTGTPTFTQGVTFNDDITFFGTPNLIGNFSYSGTPNIGGNHSYTGTPTIGGNNTQSGDITFSGGNTHSGTNTLSGTFNVTGNLNLKNQGVVGADVSAADNIRLHRESATVLQLVTADTTPSDGVEGVSPATLHPSSILGGSIVEAKIGTGAVTVNKIGALAVETAKIDNLGVTEGKINTGAVTVNKLGALAVETAKIDNLAVETAKIDNLAVTEGKINTGAVTNTKIGNLAVDTAQIAANAVTRAKIEAVGQQISTVSGAFSTTSATFVDVTNLSVTITTTGRPVMVVLAASGTTNSYLGIQSGTDTAEGRVQILRGGSVLSKYPIYTRAAGATSMITRFPPGMTSIDTPTAGTYTYKAQALALSGTTTLVYYCSLQVYEL